MDTYIQQIGKDHLQAARYHLAWTVEQTVNSLGISDSFTDENGDGPFIQAIKKGKRL